MKKFITLCLVFSMAMASFAREDGRRFAATLYGGLYLQGEPTWTVEPSVSWSFCDYIGVAFGMEMTSQFSQPSRITTINGCEASLADNEKNVAWIIFKPSAIFKSPNLLRNDGGIRLWIQAEPGISLACPFRNSLTYDIHYIDGNMVRVESMKFRNKGLEWFLLEREVFCQYRL